MKNVLGTKIEEAIHSCRSFFGILSQKTGQKLDPLVLRLDAFFGKKITRLDRIIVLLAIKYLYIFLTVTILKDQWYFGPNGYGIDFVFWKELVALLVFLLICVAYTQMKIKDRFADYTVYFLLIIYYIPLNSTFAINNQPVLFFMCSNLYFLLILVLVYYGAGFLEGLKKKDNEIVKRKAENLYKDKSVIAACMIICGLFIIYKLCYNGLSFSLSMDGDYVYGARAEFVAFLDRISGTLLAYLLSILGSIASSASLYYVLVSLISHKWKHVIFGVLCVLAQYSVSSGKVMLIYIAVIAMLYICHRIKLLKHFKRIFEIGILTLLVVCLIERFVLHSDKIFTLLIRRVMYIPVWLSTKYYEFFTQNGPVLWSQNVFLLQNLLPAVYDTSPLLLISQNYFAGQMPSPNSGLFAEAVMHFSVVGTVIYPLLLAVVFLISGMIFKPYGISVQIFMAIRLVIHLQNVPITRTDSVLSYFLFTFILWILPKMHIEKFLEGIKARLVKRKKDG